MIRPKAGEKRWSDYFGEYVYLTTFIDDDHWYFRLGNSLRNYKSQSLWSMMPLDKPESSMYLDSVVT